MPMSNLVEIMDNFTLSNGADCLMKFREGEIKIMKLIVNGKGVAYVSNSFNFSHDKTNKYIYLFINIYIYKIMILIISNCIYFNYLSK